MSLELVLGGAGLMAFSGVPGYLLPNRTLGQRVSSVLMVFGSVFGLTGVGVFLFNREVTFLRWEWFLPVGQFSVSLDALSVVFLALIFAVPGLGSVYGLGYWPASEHGNNSRRLGLAFGVLAGAMAMVVVARDGVLFLISWELMALAAFFAANAEHEKPKVAEAGWVYLVATHVGTLFLLAMFSLWSSATLSFSLENPATLTLTMATTVFSLGLVGFGFKAGMMPLHVWLPSAHANAPSHVSAVMSGVMLKMGIYGILRMTSLLPVASQWWGLSVLFLGALTGLGGIVFALGQRDVKKILAYSSIENIGIILLGIGLALLGRYYARPDWIVLGLGASLFHVFNHGLFKPLLFLGAGVVIEASGTRDIDKMGGLGQRFPGVMLAFLVGAVAISALPPLNGFASEWLLSLGFFRALTLGSAWTALAVSAGAALLALIGALVLACFVKLFGTIFLGSAKTPLANHGPGPSQSVPLVVLAATCVLVGFFPAPAASILDAAVRDWAPASALLPVSTLAPLPWLTVFGFALVLLVSCILFAFHGQRKKRTVSRLTWDCGYAQPGSRMQYTGSSLSQNLVGLFRFALWPRELRPFLPTVFPGRTRFRQQVPDFILERLVKPLFRAVGRQAPRIRFLQRGQTQIYILYVFVVTVLLLVFGEFGGFHG